MTQLWLDNITRALLRSGTLARYIAELSVTGLTSNPTILERAIDAGHDYDAGIRRLRGAGLSGEALLFELALEDLREAADLFRPIFDASSGAGGWVSLEVSPQVAGDTAQTVSEARRLHERAARPNLFMKIPGTREGVRAVEEVVFQGIPVNVTLLFTREHYLAAARAYMRGIERRVAADLDPKVESVASIFVSRWDAAVKDSVPAELCNRLGIAVATTIYKVHRDLLQSRRWKKLAASGARPQRLLWASTGTKDPAASDTLYVDALATEDTICTLPEETLLAFADHGKAAGALPPDDADAKAVLELGRLEGVDVAAVGARLQGDGLAAFAASWQKLLTRLDEKQPARASA